MNLATNIGMALALAALLAGCSSNEPKTASAGGKTVPLSEESLAGRGAMVYRSATFDPKRYNRFILEPVTVYQSAEKPFSADELSYLQGLAQFAQAEFVRVIGARYPIVTQPAADVIRVKLQIAGTEDNVPVVSTVSHVLPVGLAANLIQSARGAPGSFTGSVTLGGELTDSVSNQTMMVFIQRRYPDALDIGSTLTTQEAHRSAITQAIEAYRKRIDAVHGVAQR